MPAPNSLKRDIDRLLKSSNEDDEQQDYDQLVFDCLFNDLPPPPSRPHTRIRIDRDRVARGEQLYNDYFANNARYESKFERRFRMSKALCLRIIEDLQIHSQFWVQRPDACGVMGLTVYQKVVCALKQLTLGIPADATDDYVGIGETTAILCLKLFMKHINEIYGADYLRPPNHEELTRIMKEYELRGLPGCKGSLDGMHWAWKNCPLCWSEGK